MATSPESPATSSAPAAYRQRIGILVIHGMGEEDPYAPLDQFARGLYKYLGGAWSMRTQWKERDADPSQLQKSWTQAQVLFEPPENDPAAPRLTVAEYYWSPATKDKMKDTDVLTWLLRTGLEPFRYLNENLQAMQDAAATGRRTVAEQHRVASARHIFWREIARLLFTYPILLASFILVAGFLSQVKDFSSALAGLQGSYLVMLEGLGVVLRVLVLGSLASYLWSWTQWLRFRTVKGTTGRRYSWLALMGAVALGALVVYAPAFAKPHFFTAAPWPACASLYAGMRIVPARLQPIVAWLGQVILVRDPFSCLLVPLAELGIAAAIRNFLINYMGDVAIYTNLNQRAANFKIRAQILEECGHALTSLYTDLRDETIDERALGGRSATKENREAVARTLTADDFKVVIAAHSLGTVIAYDTINDLFNRARIHAGAAGAKAPPPGQTASDPAALDLCRHASGLLTFGSPLNKTYYFFRDQSQAEELVRGQLVDQLHSFRLLSPTGQLDTIRVTPVDVAAELQRLTTNFRWLNIWSRMDIISGKLFFYDLPEADQLQRHYWKPILAHLSYWDDQKMYAFFANRLLS